MDLKDKIAVITGGSGAIGSATAQRLAQAGANVVIGAAAAEHDLSGLGDARLRSHGGVTEARVPFILSHPLNEKYRQRAAAGPIKSHHIFDYAINGVEAGR